MHGISTLFIFFAVALCFGLRFSPPALVSQVQDAMPCVVSPFNQTSTVCADSPNSSSQVTFATDADVRMLMQPSIPIKPIGWQRGRYIANILSGQRKLRLLVDTGSADTCEFLRIFREIRRVCSS